MLIVPVEDMFAARNPGAVCGGAVAAQGAANGRPRSGVKEVELLTCRIVRVGRVLVLGVGDGRPGRDRPRATDPQGTTRPDRTIPTGVAHR